MSSQNEKVKAAEFSLADPAPVPIQKTPANSSSTHWVLAALAGLVVLALIVVFWLPGKLDGGDSTPAATETRQTEGSTAIAVNQKKQPQIEEASPWSDAQLAKQRKEAQDVLAILLDVQFELQEKGVEQWAPEAFDTAKALAQEGDTQYRERDFVAAKFSYDKALSDMEAQVEAAPLALQQRLELARRAIEDMQQQVALDALSIARAIEPSNSLLASLEQRARSVQQLQPLLSQAQEAEKLGNLASAEQLLQQASSLDPEHLTVKSELARVAGVHTLQRFNNAMSEGYSALDEGQFTPARKAFRHAANLVPGSAEANSAMRDLEAAQTSSTLSSLQNRGSRQQASEQWQQAVDTYDKALSIDSSLLFAQQGLKQSTARAQLDKQFRAAIEKPERLSDQTVAAATEQLVKHAATITPHGPVLEKQLSALNVLLQQAGAKVKLTLRSDGETEVTLRKVSRLGQFNTKQLTLRPGTYTVIGSRDGYRDVRQSFTLKHDTGALDILIVCTEEI
ncbi:MAG: tetratricopeptide (TPR) repeat protein [Halioglobus sp.]|jgi:tetratricopeptide (TPR) repeat protein